MIGQGAWSVKIVIPLFENRVSPHFQTAPALLVAEIDGKGSYNIQTTSLEGVLSTRRKRHLLDFLPDILLCGGIDAETKRWFERQGIFVKDNCMGDAMEILSSYLKNEHPLGQEGCPDGPSQAIQRSANSETAR